MLQNEQQWMATINMMNQQPNGQDQSIQLGKLDWFGDSGAVAKAAHAVHSEHRFERCFHDLAAKHATDGTAGASERVYVRADCGRPAGLVSEEIHD